MLSDLIVPSVLDLRSTGGAGIASLVWSTVPPQIRLLLSVGDVSHTESGGEFEELKLVTAFFGFGAVVGFANWLIDICLSSLDPFLGSPSETSLSLAYSLMTSLAPPAITLNSFLIEFRS